MMDGFDKKLTMIRDPAAAITALVYQLFTNIANIVNNDLAVLTASI